MRTIHKYPLAIAEYQEVRMPEGARILCAQMQRDYVIGSNQPAVNNLCVWAEVDTDNPPIYREFFMYGIGAELRKDHRFTHTYLSTVQDGRFVWHIYYR